MVIFSKNVRVESSDQRLVAVDQFPQHPHIWYMHTRRAKSQTYKPIRQ